MDVGNLNRTRWGRLRSKETWIYFGAAAQLLESSLPSSSTILSWIAFFGVTASSVQSFVSLVRGFTFIYTFIYTFIPTEQGSVTSVVLLRNLYTSSI